MAPAKPFRVYLLRCADGSLYCGITNSIKRRLKDHNEGRASKYTRSRLPVRLHAIGRPLSRSEALKLEYQIKKARRPDKLKMLRTPGHRLS